MVQGFKYRTITHINEDGLYRDMESVIKNELYASRFDQLNDPFEAMAAQSFGEAIHQRRWDLINMEQFRS